MAGFPPGHIARVRRFIVASKAHRASPSHDPDLCHALDIDMAILGVDRERYICYADAIWREYRSTYTLEQFTKGRMKWIKSTLEPENQPIFLSQVFQEKYEDSAISNLKDELERLQNR